MKRTLKILIACEESQRICTEFRKRGHEAYSCDVQERKVNKKEPLVSGGSET